MKMTEVATKNPRVLSAYEGFVKHIKNFLDEQQFNHEEYTNFVKWADRLGRSGEIPLFLDVFVETYVLEAKYKDYLNGIFIASAINCGKSVFSISPANLCACGP